MVVHKVTSRRVGAKSRLFTDRRLHQDTKPQLIQITRLQPGDVLLCWPSDADFIQRSIQRTTKSGYVHAAIVISGSPAQCAEFVAGSGLLRKEGLQVSRVDHLVQRYGHVAVLRHPDAWPKEAVEKLDVFVKRLRHRSKYALFKALHSPKAGTKRQTMHRVLLDQYFAGERVRREDQKAYFCSEFVVECFIEGGYLDASAAIIYFPAATPPSVLINDTTFGFTLGFLSTSATYQLPSHEPLNNQTSFDAIFNPSTLGRNFYRRKLGVRALLRGRRIRVPGRIRAAAFLPDYASTDPTHAKVPSAQYSLLR